MVRFHGFRRWLFALAACGIVGAGVGFAVASATASLQAPPGPAKRSLRMAFCNFARFTFTVQRDDGKSFLNITGAECWFTQNGVTDPTIMNPVSWDYLPSLTRVHPNQKIATLVFIAKEAMATTVPAKGAVTITVRDTNGDVVTGPINVDEIDADPCDPDAEPAPPPPPPSHHLPEQVPAPPDGPDQKLPSLPPLPEVER